MGTTTLEAEQILNPPDQGRAPMIATRDFETEVQDIGHRLYARAARRIPSLYRGFAGAMIRQTMDDERLRTALFQFVDTLPQLHGSTDIARHLAAYLAGVPRSGWQGRMLGLAARPTFAWTVGLFCRRLARQFLAEESEAGVLRAIDRLARAGAMATIDTVGEAVLSEGEADAYLARNLTLIDWLARRGPPQISIKLTGLTPRFEPLDAGGTRKRLYARLAPLLEVASRHGATVTIDMEQHELKALTLDLFLDVVNDFAGAWRPAVALQAYLPETGDDLARVLAAAEKTGRRIGVRLVKGAYWDQELAWAAQRGWPLPTYREKTATDAAFERHAAWLLERSEALHPAIASHNLRSQAVALAHARRLQVDVDRWETQVLRGMAEPLLTALIAEGAPTRVYVPTGDLTIGIAYLIRRLLENSASNSVLRLAYVDGADVDALLAAPSAADETIDDDAIDFRNLPHTDFSAAGARDAMARALVDLRATLPRHHALDGATVGHRAANPARPDETLGEIGLAGVDHVRDAIAQARAAFAGWRDTPAAERCAILERAADTIETERFRLAALEVLEGAKPWREADADIAEAVDFLRFYAHGMRGLADWRTTVDYPGQTNRYGYAPRGICVVIAPWNFPLAILAGMTSAALVTGNSVIMKPALPALLIAHELLRILHDAGVPPGALQLLPGEAEVGAALVADPDVQVIAFTGSRRVGLQILAAAHTQVPGQRHVKQVVCEMGGKNAIIVDTDADLDEAVPGIVGSAFGYSGQKCSACARVIAVGRVRERLLPRLCEAADALAWGPPEDPAFDHGPLITAAARDKALSYLEIGRGEGHPAWQGKVPDDGGWYAPPAVIADIRPEHRLAREEVFGPVLAVMDAPDFATALDIAIDVDYGLTGGVYSRLPEHLALAQERFRVGNLYLNRKITGSLVGVQPFGGIALSGTGVQAGGPDYLKQFLWSRSVSANTQRHGFIPGR